ncbi:hypothetical protein [Microbacterium hydrocarbonoxydans]|uniref:hypothetical protein n=1 Tax=Microbacterium hydrocarbonoxydans TaxID=273678 RepID=UPI0020401295|nr:hypothetical protein [Microbacterium hydrocarbonoxydans]MCM3778691.1 hypothetical protein [Microbacterium hydrocarbonoxydans]
MNAQATRRGVPAAVLWGGVGAVAWAAITILTGGSSAHADEHSDAPLLDGVSSLVSQTVSTVGSTVTAVTQPVVTEVVAPVVTEVVAPVVEHVAAPVQQAAPAVVETVTETVAAVPVVGPATAPVVETVTDTAQAAVAPVTDLLQDAPVSQIVRPVQNAVSALPIVGRLVDGLGVNTLLTDVVGVVDETTAVVGGVVENTLPPVLVALDPTSGIAADRPVSPASAVSGSQTRGTRLPAAPAAANLAIAEAEPVTAPASPGTSVPSPDEEKAPSPSHGGSPAIPASAGSNGASGLSHARLSDVGPFALRAVERTPGAPDDVLPTSLVADTDVSPD